MTGEVLAIGAWTTNAAMIADVARLGYLDGTVLDATYGEGNFWTIWQPRELHANDLHKLPPLGVGRRSQNDYRNLPYADSTFDAVVFDPPYRLSGRRDRPQDALYGTETPASRAAVLGDLVDGALECYRVTARYLLVKCQDQVEGGRKRWQTDLVTVAIEHAGGRKVDRFDFVTSLRPQPPGRRQLTSRGNYSTLLIFEKGRTR